MATTKQASESDATGTSPKTSASRSRKSSKSSRRGATAKRSTRASSRSRSGSNGTMNGIMSRGRSAISQAYGLAEQAGSVGSRAMRNMPDTRSIQTMMDERPLLLGAVGLGIGVLIGAMLPSMHSGSSNQRGRR